MIITEIHNKSGKKKRRATSRKIPFSVKKKKPLLKGYGIDIEKDIDYQKFVKYVSRHTLLYLEQYTPTYLGYFVLMVEYGNISCIRESEVVKVRDNALLFVALFNYKLATNDIEFYNSTMDYIIELTKPEPINTPPIEARNRRIKLLYDLYSFSLSSIINYEFSTNQDILSWR